MAISTTPLVDISTLDAKIRKIAVPVLERRKVFDRLRKAGNIITGQTGTEISWLVDFKDHETQALDDLTYIQAPRFNTLKKATLEWVARASGSSISEMEKRMNASTSGSDLDTQWAQILGLRTQKAVEALANWMSDSFWVNASATGNSEYMSGLPTVIGAKTTNYAHTNAAQPVALPGTAGGVTNFTYAGLITTPGYYGGSWSTTSAEYDWPIGTGDKEWHFWTPLIVDYGNADFSGSSNDWANQGREAIRYANIAHMILHKKPMDEVMMSPAMYNQYWLSIDSKEQIMIPRGSGGGALKEGYVESLDTPHTFDGTALSTEYGIPAGYAYGVDWSQIEFRSLLGKPKGAGEVKMNGLIEMVKDVDKHRLLDENLVWAFGNYVVRTPSAVTCFVDM